MSKVDIKELRRFAIIDNKEAQYTLGTIYLENKKLKDIDKAIFWLTKSSELGCKEAMSLLGNIYSNNNYGVYNKNMAIKFYQMAYDHGDYTAMMMLSLLKR